MTNRALSIKLIDSLICSFFPELINPPSSTLFTGKKECLALTCVTWKPKRVGKYGFFYKKKNTNEVIKPLKKSKSTFS